MIAAMLAFSLVVPNQLSKESATLRASGLRGNFSQLSASAAVSPLDRHDRVLHYVALQAGAAAADLWTTGYCLDRNPSCREGNPLGRTVEQRVALKFIHVGVFAAGANKLERSGHSNWARAVTWFGVAVQLAAAINNVHVAGKRPK